MPFVPTPSTGRRERGAPTLEDQIRMQEDGRRGGVPSPIMEKVRIEEKLLFRSVSSHMVDHKWASGQRTEITINPDTWSGKSN